MDTNTATHPTRQVSDAAAHMSGMNNTSMSAIAADALRKATVSPNYDATHQAVNEAARRIAQIGLELSGGRSTYSWEGNGIRLTYTGDTTDVNGDFAYGPTVREYLVDGEYKTTAPVRSQSGTGLLNLALDHVTGCTDPVVEAKRLIAWLLLDPSLELVEYVIRTTTQWQGMNRETQGKKMALNIRLHEIIEQKCLENPGAGLDLRDIAENGTNVVGYMVKTLDGCVRPIMNRIKENEDKAVTTLDAAADDDSAYRTQVADVPTESQPRSAESTVIDGADDRRAMMLYEKAKAEEEAVAAAKAANRAAVEAGQSKPHVVRSRKNSEKAAMVSRTFLEQLGLPALNMPDNATREAMLAELAAEEAVYQAKVAEAEKEAAELSAKLSEETGKKYKVKADLPAREGVAFHSFMAWHKLVNREDYPVEVPDEWLGLWENFSADDTELMLSRVATRSERVARIVEGLLPAPEPMNSATKKRVRDMMRRLADDDELNALVNAAITAYDGMMQGADPAKWEAAAQMVCSHKAAPANITDAKALAAAFDEFAAALVY